MVTKLGRVEAAIDYTDMTAVEGTCAKLGCSSEVDTTAIVIGSKSELVGGTAFAADGVVALTYD